MKKWFDFIDYGPKIVRKVTKIQVEFLGIPKLVVVKTRRNGGVL